MVAPVNEVHVWRTELCGPSGPTLRRVLARYLGEEPERIELSTGVHGKPALAGRSPRLRFNLSHSGELALVAVAAEVEVGIDIEETRRKRDFLRLAERGLDPEAAAMVRGAPLAGRAEAFYAAWTHHEAVVKCLGVGLAAPLPSQPVSVSRLDLGERHVAAVAVASPSPLPVRHFSLPAD